MSTGGVPVIIPGSHILVSNTFRKAYHVPEEAKMHQMNGVFTYAGNPGCVALVYLCRVVKGQNMRGKFSDVICHVLAIVFEQVFN